TAAWPATPTARATAPRPPPGRTPTTASGTPARPAALLSVVRSLRDRTVRLRSNRTTASHPEPLMPRPRSILIPLAALMVAAGVAAVFVVPGCDRGSLSTG